MKKKIITLALASLLSTSTHHAMEIKPLSLGLGALASLAALAYLYTQKSTPEITIIPEHTPHKKDKPDHYFLFTLYKPATKDRIGSISATYNRPKQTATVQFLHVAPDYQKQGYGLQLWNSMMNALKKEKIKTVTWKALPADILPSSMNSKEYQQKLDGLIAWYQKRGGILIEKNSAEAYMKMLLQPLYA